MSARRTPIAICAVLLVALSVHESKALGIRAKGGFAHIAYGDFNEFAQGVNEQIASDPEVSGELGAINWVPELGAELLVPILPRLELGLGAGAIWGSSNFTFSSGAATFSFEHTVKSFPIGATLYATIPVPMSFAKPFISAGGAAYYTILGFEERLGAAGTVLGYDATLSSWGFGFHGAAGISLDILPGADIEIGFGGRYAKVRGFEGNATNTTGESLDVALGFYEDEHGYKIYGPVDASESSSVGEGTVDLSGYAVTLAVRVSY